jgi:hypothetical protein
MDLAVLEKLLYSLAETNVTKNIHRKAYPAISPSRPELSQAGKVVLIPGGGTSVGLSIARGFVQASADTVIIIGRRADVLATAASQLEVEAKSAGTNTKIVHRTVDIVNLAQVDAFWKELAAQNITVDVWVANAAKFTQPKPLLELGAEEVWSQVEVNAKSPLYFAERFYAQPGEKQKVTCPLFFGVMCEQFLTTQGIIVHCQRLDGISAWDGPRRSEGASCVHSFESNQYLSLPAPCSGRASREGSSR